MGNLKRFVNDPLFIVAWEEYIQSKLKSVHTSLEIATDPSILFRYQGQAEAYKRLLKLRDDVNSLDKN